MTRLLMLSSDHRAFDELQELLGEDVEIVSTQEVGVAPPDEDGTTFTQNAMDMADAAARASGLLTIAESAGIIVDALDGAPGVASAQFAGPDATDAENRALLLERVHDSGSTSRFARLVSAIGVAHPDGRLRSFESTIEGVVATEERGVEGVGYEPIFELDDGMTIAELLPDDREDANPRLTAFADALPFIRELLER
jgi:XTP/dITP diphosphohydrolase